MAGLVIQTHNVYNFNDLPNPLKVGAQPLTSRQGYDRHIHPEVGVLEYRNVSFPHIHVMDLYWKTNKALKLVNQIPTDTINFNFQLSGVNDVHYEAADQNVYIQKGQHYMVYNADREFYNRVEANTQLSVLHIAVDKAFFAASIGCNSKWAEHIQNNLALNKPFLSAKQALGVSPAMHQLIQGIIADKSPEPMRNFMVQSRAMELIAAHIEQVVPAELNAGTSPADTEKLHQVKAFLDQAFLEEHTLNQLSRRFALNDFKLKRGFKLLFDVPVFAYIKNLRMNYATLLLKDGNASVDEVAFLLGYEYPQHFSTAYKKHTGINPSQLKK
ncbi:AraC family transcriptional regulator [Mucilaginibacter conchicola]|uniref:AraC family transcriptional regulator n=1 Tax=Mucilaginibacter conchicola TaxID=2303333 RepID=A0A372NXU9_9SPHI|nr:AraC family transcriptional regulator [Mucilaginibacter conchicola]RFZ94930.1 AraC family transcriptional regulator [Mucilaginibacter conchicola]